MSCDGIKVDDRLRARGAQAVFPDTSFAAVRALFKAMTKA